MPVNLDQSLFQNIDIGSLLVGLVMLFAATGFLRILIPISIAQLRQRNKDGMASRRARQLATVGSLVAMLVWNGLVWLDFSIFSWAFIGAPWVRWPADFALGTLVLIGSLYVFLSFSEGRGRDGIIIVPLDQLEGHAIYRPEVDVALQDALSIAHRAEELDHQLRILLNERARVMGDERAAMQGSGEIHPTASSPFSGG